MSMEIFLLTNDAVPTSQVWQKGIEALGFDVRFANEQSLQAKYTRLPADIQGKTVLLELLQTDLNDVRETFPGAAFPERIGHVHTLRWSMTFEGGAAAYQAAAAYLALVGGLMIDSEEGQLKTPDAAIQLARRVAAEIAVAEAALKKMFGEQMFDKRKN